MSFVQDLINLPFICGQVLTCVQSVVHLLSTLPPTIVATTATVDLAAHSVVAQSLHFSFFLDYWRSFIPFFAFSWVSRIHADYSLRPSPILIIPEKKME